MLYRGQAASAVLRVLESLTGIRHELMWEAKAGSDETLSALPAVRRLVKESPGETPFAVAIVHPEEDSIQRATGLSVRAVYHTRDLVNVALVCARRPPVGQWRFREMKRRDQEDGSPTDGDPKEDKTEAIESGPSNSSELDSKTSEGETAVVQDGATTAEYIKAVRDAAVMFKLTEDEIADVDIVARQVSRGAKVPSYDLLMAAEDESWARKYLKPIQRIARSIRDQQDTTLKIRSAGSQRESFEAWREGLDWE